MSLDENKDTTASLSSVSGEEFNIASEKKLEIKFEVSIMDSTTNNAMTLSLTYGFDIDKVAQLANLPLTSEEEEKYSEQLSKVLDYMEQLNKVDTSGVEPTVNVGNLSNVMREDKTETGLTQDEALQNVSSKEDGFFKVKAIFEERG